MSLEEEKYSLIEEGKDPEEYFFKEIQPMY